MRFQTLREWLHWQADLHPKAVDLSLDRVRAVFKKLNLEPFTPRVITVGGTNGKGSCVAFLESILLKAGYRVGSFTSPHLIRYNERIRINAKESSDLSICRAFGRVDEARGEISLTYFEFGVLAALDIFSAESLDVVVLEVGLGGRLDAVNMIDADASLVTNVSLDHTEWLGEDRELIALEKAGIFRSGRPAIIGEEDPPQALLDYCASQQITPIIAGRDYRYRITGSHWSWQGSEWQFERLLLPVLKGRHQLQNAASVLAVLESLREHLPVATQAVIEGISTAVVPGRFQVITSDVDRPEIILEVAHNQAAVETLVENLNARSIEGRTLALFAALDDKAIEAMVGAMVSQVDKWYLTALPGPRALPLDDLKRRVINSGVDSEQVVACPSVDEAFWQARKESFSNDRLLGFGSFVLVGRLMELVSLDKYK